MEVKIQLVRLILQEFVKISFHHQEVLSTWDEFINTIIYGEEQLTCNLLRDSAEILKVQSFSEIVLKKGLAKRINLFIIKSFHPR